MSNLRPNPMYLLNSLETALLREKYLPPSLRAEFGIAIAKIDFRDRTHNDFAKMWLGEQRFLRECRHILIEGNVPTTVKVPHHIHEDGRVEEMPDRKFPFRTYYDGSFIDKLGHAVAIHIDKDHGLITSQCPRGKDIPIGVQVALRRAFPDYSFETIRIQQQRDSHSCSFYTFYNLLVFAGVKSADAPIDIMAWREELLDALEEIEASAHLENSIRGVIVERLQAFRRDTAPSIFYRRYLEQTP